MRAASMRESTQGLLVAFRLFTTVMVGINNHGTGAVFAPTEIRVEFGDDGVLFATPYVFRRSDGTLPLVAMGIRPYKD